MEGKKKRFIPYLFLMPAVMVLFCIVMYPFLSSLFVSFHSWYLANPLGPRFAGLRNYSSLLTDPFIYTAFKLAFVFLGITIGAQMAIGIGLALWLNSPYLKWKKVFRSIFIIPMMIAPAVVATLWRIMFVGQYGILTYVASLFGLGNIGWIDNPSMAMFSLCVVAIWQWTPFVMLIILAGLQSIGKELLEAAQVDGATDRKILHYITFPLLRPYIVIAFIMRIIFGFRAFEVFRIITRGGPGRATEPIMLTLYLKGFQYLRIGQASALSYLMLLMVIVPIMIFASKLFPTITKE
jgi:multiple sugar transport system permease protein